jgi:hypothetical protein
VQRYGGATDNVERRMRYTSWITEAISTHSELVIMIFFPRQHWLRESVSVFRYTYIAFPVIYVTMLCLC